MPNKMHEADPALMGIQNGMTLPPYDEPVP
jgi:hypothetical protein